jgi:hypothetical protein
MASFSVINTIAEDTGFLRRVHYALMIAAVNVAAEGAVANHTPRLAYAQTVFAGTANIKAVALAVLTNASIAAEVNMAQPLDFAIPDSDIQFAVNSLYSALAGVG